MRALWTGRVPLPRAFWDYAVLGGFAINFVATVGSLALIVAEYPAPLALVVHFAPLPYTVLTLVGVWRSAERYGGPPLWAKAARAAIVIWTMALIVL